MSAILLRAILAVILVGAASGQAPGEGDYCPDGSPVRVCETEPCEPCPSPPLPQPVPVAVPPPLPVVSPSAPSGGDDCPQPAPLCLIFPCDPRVAKCTAFPDAECRVDCECGFFFVDAQGATLKCEDPELDPICSLPPDMGPCEAAIEKWFFNVNSGQCESFTYGGCEGNGNRFTSQEECQNSRCGSPGGIPDPVQCTQRGESCGPSNFECCGGLRCCYSRGPFQYPRRIGSVGNLSLIGACLPYCG